MCTSSTCVGKDQIKIKLSPNSSCEILKIKNIVVLTNSGSKEGFFPRLGTPKYRFHIKFNFPHCVNVAFQLFFVGIFSIITSHDFIHFCKINFSQYMLPVSFPWRSLLVELSWPKQVRFVLNDQYRQSPAINVWLANNTILMDFFAICHYVTVFLQQQIL